ncbi:mandelate racemase/muconate lactonizing enzyme family protein [Amaricoccus sp. W119]|uniref:mandelate racemase/muconate lactonizing enzyme family protein n=1 Tax=Amaricoccus sp. W119 TaxID=3391833 RepID=UPI0039A63BD2
MNSETTTLSRAAQPSATPTGAPGVARHRIADIEVHLVSTQAPSGLADATRKVETVGMTVVRVKTDQGLEGVGVTYHEVGGPAVRALIEKDMLPRLKGRDPFDTEVIWREFFAVFRGVGRKGLMFCALSAIDFALWDLKGKILGMPLHRLLGGGRSRIPVYASGGWASYDDDQLVAEMKDMVAQGYRMVKFKIGYDGGRQPNRDVERVRKVREALGPDIGLMIDANNCWDAATAVQFGNRVREYNPMLLEEPVFADDIPGLARFKRGCDIPLGTGEHEYTKWGVRDLLLADAADIVQIDGARTGGYTEMMKCAALCEAWNVKFAPHAMEHIHIPIASVCGNVPFLERLRLFEPITHSVYLNAQVPTDGHLDVIEAPGHGLRLDMDFIRDADERD